MADEELHETAADGQKDMQSEGAATTATVVTDDAVVEETVTETPEDTGAAADDGATGAKADAAAADEDESSQAAVDENEADAAKGAEKAYEADEEESSDVDDDEDDALDIPMDKVEALLNADVDEENLTPQMRRMMRRQDENTHRVEESIKGTKANPRWFVPLFCALMIIGLIWAVVFYLTYDFPIPGIHQWNLLIAFAFIMVGFIMTMWWR